MSNNKVLAIILCSTLIFLSFGAFFVWRGQNNAQKAETRERSRVEHKERMERMDEELKEIRELKEKIKGIKKERERINSIEEKCEKEAERTLREELKKYKID